MSVITISEGQHLAEAIELLFTSDVPGWFTPFVTVLDGLTAAQAAAVPAERFNSVWGVTNHLRFFQEVALCQLQGMNVDYAELGSPDGSGWPVVVNGDEDAWQKAKQQVVKANKALAEYIARLSTEELDQIISDNVHWNTRRHLIQSVIAHNSYHTCEVISIRHMQGLWFNAM